MKRNLKLHAPYGSKIKNLKFWVIIGISVLLLATIHNQQQVNQTATLIPSPTPLVLTEDEKFILNPPPADASRSALVKHAKMVAKEAKVADSLEVNNCRPNPLVLNVKLGSNLKIQNNDDSEHRIIVDSKHYYKIPARMSQIIKVDFKYGTGDYGYVCEGAGIVGFLHVTS